MRLRVHHQWILRGLGGEELRVQPFDAPRPPRWVLLPPMFPIGYLDRWLSEPDARRTLVEIHETLFGRLTLPVWSDDEIALAIRPRLITALDRKDLVVLTPLRANAPRPVPDPVPIIPPRKEEPKDETTWFELRVVDEVGAAIAGLDIDMTVDSAKRTLATDGEGVVRTDNARTSFASGEVARASQLRTILKPRWSSPRKQSPPTGDHVVTQRIDQLAPVSLEDKVRTTLVILPRYRCEEIPGACFEFGRSFPRREAISKLASIADELRRDEDERALLFGHADTAGPDLPNKELSERRAEAIFALLTHKDDLWEELWTDAKGKSWHEKWGAWEAAHMLTTLGLAVEDANSADQLKASVQSFQRGDYKGKPAEQSTLDPTGKLDQATRKELFLAYAKRITRQPVPEGRFSTIHDASWMGCGKYNPVSASARDKESRRVVALLFDVAATPSPLPCKLGDVKPCEATPLRAASKDDKPPYRCPIYTKIAASCPCNGGADLSHDLYVRFTTRQEELTTLSHELVLRSEDKTVEQRKKLRDEVRATQDGGGEIVYTDLPDVLRYRLDAEGIDEPYPVFELTPYHELSELCKPRPAPVAPRVISLLPKPGKDPGKAGA